MNVVFFLDNENHTNVDYSNPMGGNPGIGGAQYMIWLIVALLSNRHNDLNVYLAAKNIDNMPEKVKCIKIDSAIDCISESEKIKADILVYRSEKIDNEFYRKIKKTDMKIIAWSHNFEPYYRAQDFARCHNIKRNVCVGKEQYDRLRDHEVYKKSTYIYNAITYDIYNANTNEKIDNSVCYLGSLHEPKGFHKLARNWARIERKVKDAQLYVLGSGTLYDKNTRLGKYGLAESRYEKKFIKYLIDRDGKIKENVHFMGTVGGEEKLALMSKMQVGIVNPTGISETFCIGAIEFEALRIPVVTIKKYSLVETVDDKKSGLLFKNDRQFVNNVVRLLSEKQLNQEMGNYGCEWVRDKFSLEKVLDKWYQIICDVYNDVPAIIEYNYDNLWNNHKWIREINRRIRKIFKFMPSVLWYEHLPHMCMNIIRKLKS